MSFAKYHRLDLNEVHQKENSYEIDYGSYYKDEFSNTNDKTDVYKSIYKTDVIKDDANKYFSYSVDSWKNYKSYFTYDTSHKFPNFKVTENVSKPNIVVWLAGSFIILLLYVIVFVTFPLSAWFTLKKVKDYQRLVIYRLGIRLAVKKHGYSILLPMVDQWTMIDMRTKAFNVPPQHILLIDSAGIEVGADVFYQITDPVLSISACCDINSSTRVLVQTTMTRLLSKHCLDDIVNRNRVIVQEMMTDLNTFIQPWGLTISRIDLSEIKIHSEPKPGAGLPGGNPMDILKSIISSVMSPSDNSSSLVDLNTVVEKVESTVDMSKVDNFENIGQEKLSMELLVNTIRLQLNVKLVDQYGIIYKFIVTGVGGGIFILDLKNGDGYIGSPPNSQKMNVDVVLKLSFDDLNSIFDGSLSTFNAYMSGRLEVVGDLQAAMKLQDLLTCLPSRNV